MRCPITSFQFGFSRAELYSFFNTGESIAGNVFFVTGTATLVTVNPVVAGVAFTAKVTQAAFLVGKVAFSENPLNELVQSGVTFIAGKAAGAAAGQAFQAAKRAGLADGLIDSAVELASRKQACRFIWTAPRAIGICKMEEPPSCIAARTCADPAAEQSIFPAFFSIAPGLIGTIQR